MLAYDLHDEEGACVIQRRATIEDLYEVEGPAELVGGRIVRDMTGERPGEVAENIFVSLRAHARNQGHGKAHGDGVGYVARVDASDRESFCPDASYHTRPPAANPMRFIEGAPDFAVEVRSENDYGQAAERELADKRGDYFAAGTLVVWDVDPVNEVVTIYRAADPSRPTTLRRGATADAEPAVPGWRIAVDEVFS
jgi:Uma2 family endonuclease